eukprot:m.302256 g.302256  ORF g.302256 m.302256 type:complete len:61 (+) comp157275_c0_seq1:3-185(+)
MAQAEQTKLENKDNAKLKAGMIEFATLPSTHRVRNITTFRRILNNLSKSMTKFKVRVLHA